MILGAGPTGLGAAWRLQERGHAEFLVLEAEGQPGGLAASFVDPQGFTWDLGGHVQFSHYTYFDRLMDSLLPGRWLVHPRQAWVRMRGAWVPYPFQLNLRHLPDGPREDCVRGLLRIALTPPSGSPGNFAEWIRASFGAGIARHFMLPYNFKVWAHPPEDMSWQWIGERVAQVDLERALRNLVEGRDDLAWGPNHTFRFPDRGGTGEIWRSLAARLGPGRLRLGARVVGIDPGARRVRLEDGGCEAYDRLVSTLPLDRLVALAGLGALGGAAARLRYSSVHIVGVGIRGTPPEALAGKCWIYFPDDDSPFYRATVFSNYAPANVPEPGRTWSLMTEVSESSHKPVDRARVVQDVVEGLHATGLLPDRDRVMSLWSRRLEHGYPTPFLGRDAVLAELLPALDRLGIHSRGRFGAWKYEVSNQDHSLMQGVELVDRLLDGGREPTVEDPDAVNRPGKR